LLKPDPFHLVLGQPLLRPIIEHSKLGARGRGVSVQFWWTPLPENEDAAAGEGIRTLNPNLGKVVR
jgi:hypothetical protein